MGDGPSLEFTLHGLLALFERSPVAQAAILPDDPQFTIVAASDGYLRRTEAKREDLMGRSVLVLFPDNLNSVHASGAANLRASLKRVIANRSPDRLPLQRYDLESPERGFEERYWNVLNTPVLGADGRLEYILHSVEEVTEQVTAERRIRQAQHAGRVGTFEWLVKQNRLICTPELEALYGLPEGGFAAGLEFWRTRVVAEDGARVAAELESCMQRRAAKHVYEFRAVQPDGTTRWLRGQAQFFYDENGAPERMIGATIDIEAQKQAEGDLRESEQRLRAIYDGTYEYIGLLTPDGILLEANRASLEFANSTRKDVVGRAFWDGPWFAYTPGAPERVKRAIERAAAGEFVRFEATVRRPSGETPTFDISFHPVRDEAGKVVLIVPEGRNITEHKESKEQLEQQWHIFDSALSHTPDHTYTLDLHGRFTYANSALLSMWRRTLPEALGKNFFELGYPPALAERVHRQIQQVIDTAQPVRDHTDLTDASGENHYFDYIFVPVLGADGRVEAVAGSTRDITDRDRMEKALAASEQKLRQVLEQAPVAIVVFRGRDFIVEIANPTYQALFQQREPVGRRFADVLPELPQNVWEAFRKVFDTGEPFMANEWRIPYDADNDGAIEDHWFNVAYNPWRDADGVVTGMIAVLTDVSEQVLARKELERVNRELEEFSYVASHDLQEPLRTVNIYTHLMLKRIGEQGGEINTYAGFVRKGVSRMEALLKDLLTFSRAVHADTSRPLGTADLSASLREALSVLHNDIEESGAVITAGPLPAVHADTEQMTHVFQNLLSNAIKYRKKDTRLDVQISAEQRCGEWTISVRDNGIGFEPQYSERIFGLFKRLHRDEYPGTGLGLAICQRIVARYGGRMWAEGRPGEGAAVYFSLAGEMQNRSAAE